MNTPKCLGEPSTIAILFVCRKLQQRQGIVGTSNGLGKIALGEFSPENFHRWSAWGPAARCELAGLVCELHAYACLDLTGGELKRNCHCCCRSSVCAGRGAIKNATASIQESLAREVRSCSSATMRLPMLTHHQTQLFSSATRDSTLESHVRPSSQPPCVPAYACRHRGHRSLSPSGDTGSLHQK